MNKLELVIISMAFLAVSIPSVLSDGTSCDNQLTCLNKSGKTECCVGAVKGGKSGRCETVTVDLLNTAVTALQPLPEVGNLPNQIEAFIKKLKPNAPLKLNSNICKLYAIAQDTIAKGGYAIGGK